MPSEVHHDSLLCECHLTSTLGETRPAAIGHVSVACTRTPTTNNTGIFVATCSACETRDSQNPFAFLLCTWHTVFRPRVDLSIDTWFMHCTQVAVYATFFSLHYSSFFAIFWRSCIAVSLGFGFSSTMILFVWLKSHVKTSRVVVCARKMSNMAAVPGEWARDTGYGDDRTACGVGPAHNVMSQRGGHRDAPSHLGARVPGGTTEIQSTKFSLKELGRRRRLRGERLGEDEEGSAR